MKLNFWESFAISTGVGALQALVSQKTSLNPQQQADVQRALTDLQAIQADFAQ